MSALEKHYSVAEIAELWQLSHDSIRRIFRDRPDVLKMSAAETRFKRGYCVLRVPESVVQKVHADLRK